MITSFKCKRTEQIFDGKTPKRFPATLVRRAIVKLDQLNSATILEDLRISLSNRLEALSGDRRGQHSIRINDQFRICFNWDGGNATNVEIIHLLVEPADYH